MNVSAVKTFEFKQDGFIPNHPHLPALLYPGALSGKEARMDSIFNQNKWLNSWTNGVYPYHHYHSSTHEVLGVMQGMAVLIIGGEHGEKIEVGSGDILVLPAGTGHKRLSASADFLVIGAYPDGMDYNLKTEQDELTPTVLEQIRRAPLPAADPVYGSHGPLIQLWITAD